MEPISCETLTSIITFLKEHRWLYDFPMTHVFANDCLSWFPLDWKKSLSALPSEHLNGIPQCTAQVNWPASLKLFLQTCEKFTVRRFLENKLKKEGSACQKKENILPFYLPKYHLRKMSPKKKHEVENLTSVIQQLLNITKSRHIVDIGSGLGYIDAALHYHLNVSILGAESDEAKVKQACERQKGPKGKESCPRVKHIHWTLQDTKKNIQETCAVIDKYYKTEEPCHCSREEKHKSRETEDSLGNERCRKVGYDGTEFLSTEEEKCGGVTLMGLHACADLSPVMLKTFLSSPSISSLVLLSCCYHKMQPRSSVNECDCDDNWKIVGNHKESSNANHDEKNYLFSGSANACEHSGFNNFPMSKEVKEICENKGFFPSIYGLRLAAQESGQRWIQMTAEAHETHVKNVAFRAILEAYCAQNGLTLKKKKRRCARSSQFSTFEEYVGIMTANHSFVEVQDTQKSRKDPSLEVIHEAVTDDLLHLYSKYEPMFDFLEPLTGLQLALQPVWEALVALDRVVYLQELGYQEVWLEQVFEETLSPRCVALVAVKK